MLQVLSDREKEHIKGRFWSGSSTLFGSEMVSFPKSTAQDLGLCRDKTKNFILNSIKMSAN